MRLLREIRLDELRADPHGDRAQGPGPEPLAGRDELEGRKQMNSRWAWLWAAGLVAATAQEAATTNADVIKMVKGGLEESVVVVAAACAVAATRPAAQSHAHR